MSSSSTRTVNRGRALKFGRYDYASFLTFFAYSSAAMVLPVALVLVGEELDFPLKEGGMSAGGALSLAGSLPMVASMLLCGFAAGRWGKRLVFGIAVATMGLGLALSAATPTYAFLVMAVLISGFGEGFLEGLATPFVRDLHPDEPGRYVNIAHSFWSVGVLTAVLVSGIALSRSVSWRFLLLAVAGLSFIASAAILLPARKGKGYPDHPEPIHWKETRKQLADILRRPRFWRYFAAMFVAGGGEFSLTFWCASYVQLNFLNDPKAGGYGTAIFAAGMVLGRLGWGYLIRQERLKSLIFWSAVAGVVFTLLLPHANSLWIFFALLLPTGLATAPYWPSLQSHCHDLMPDTDSTLLMILLSCAGVPGCGFFTWLIGYLGDLNGGLDLAFYLIPGCFAILALLMWWDGKVEIRDGSSIDGHAG